MKRALALFSLILIAVSLVPSCALADTKPAWTLGLDSPLRWFRGASEGMLLVGTGREILGVRREDGSVQWRLGPAEDSSVGDAEPLAPFPYALVSLGKRKAPTLPSVFLIDVRDGHTVWTADSLGVGWSIGSYLIPGTNRLLLRSALKPKGKTQTAMLLDVKEGRRLWTKQELGENLQPDTVFSERVRVREGPFFESDSTLILYTDSRTLRRYDLRTGEVLWEDNELPMPGRDILPGSGEGGGLLRGLKGLVGEGGHGAGRPEEAKVFDALYAPMLVARTGDRFYTPYRNTVLPISRETGRYLWKLPPQLSGIVVQMQDIPAGLVVRTISYDQGSPSFAVYLLQRDTGLRLWRAPGKTSGFISRFSGTWSSASNFLVEDDRILIATEGKLMTVDIQTGKDRVLGKLGFENGDDPLFLYHVTEGICVAGSQNLAIYSSDGRRIRKFYREAPGGNTGVGLTLLGASVFSYGTGFLEDGITPEPGLHELTKEYTSTRQRDDYVYFLANLQAGGDTKPGLVRVNRRTGNPEGEIILGTKKPDYTVDPDGRVIFTPDPKTLICYRF